MSIARVHLHARRAKPFYARHPWVYAGAIDRIDGEPTDGDEVDVFSHGGQFIARGLFNSQSRIRVRLYTWNAGEPLDRAFFRQRLETAIALRRDVLKLAGPGRACRLVFSEGDGLSGMTVDQYDRWLVLQFTGLGLAHRRTEIAEVLAELQLWDGFPTRPEIQSGRVGNPSHLGNSSYGIYLRTERGIGKLEGLELQDGPLSGTLPTEPIVIDEDGVEFLVDLAEGQKTGFYLDQRENRRVVAGYAHGRRMLDAFCYTGGFGLHAARAGATEVIGVDVSGPGLKLAQRNAERNGLTNIRFENSEVFEYLEAAVRAGERFGLIVLDPPKFARAQRAVDDALRGYRRLQALALMLLEPGGVLATCCCSGLIQMTMLEELAAQVAADARRSVQILERRCQPADHPVAVSCLESSYLKCLVTRVSG